MKDSRTTAMSPAELSGRVLCRQCRHHRYDRRPEDRDVSGIVAVKPEEAEAFLRTIWHNQLCAAQPRTEFDFVTGTKSTSLDHCRNLNGAGRCTSYEVKT